MNKVTPLSRALIMNGDITPTGQQSQYDDVKRVLNKNKHPENVWSTVGNHEFYAGKWTADGKLSQSTWPNGVTEETLFGRYYLVDKKRYIIKRIRWVSASIFRN